MTRRVVFNVAVLGIPNGGGSTHSFDRGDVADLPEGEYELLEGRRDRRGIRWVAETDLELRRLGPTSIPRETKPLPVLSGPSGATGRPGEWGSDWDREDGDRADRAAEEREVRERKRSERTCPVCSREFSYPSGLRKHMRTHGGKGSYICPLCGEGFDSSQARGGHTRRVHQERELKVRVEPVTRGPIG